MPDFDHDRRYGHSRNDDVVWNVVSNTTDHDVDDGGIDDIRYTDKTTATSFTHPRAELTRCFTHPVLNSRSPNAPGT